MYELVPVETSVDGQWSQPKHAYLPVNETFLSLDPTAMDCYPDAEAAVPKKWVLRRRSAGAGDLSTADRGYNPELQQWTRHCRALFSSVVAGARYFGRGGGGGGGGEGWGQDLRERLALLTGQARLQVERLQASVVDRVAGWRNLNREEDWADAWARWRADARLQFMFVRAFLLERLQAILLRNANLIREAFALWWTLLTERLVPQSQDYFRAKYRIWRSKFRLHLLRQKRRGGWWGVVRSFALSSRDGMSQCCWDFLHVDEDLIVGEDVAFLLSNSEAKAVVVVLVFVFSLLLEVLAASCLDDLISAPVADHGVLLLSERYLAHNVMTSFVFGV
nr:hypothetical protein BaRGS_024438 [Batillaria attramentaria]